MRDRLRGFTLRDRQGELVGEVQDLTLDPANPQKQFNLVVLQPDMHLGSRSFLLHNRQLEKIDIPGRSLFARLSAAEIRRIPDYSAPINGVQRPQSAELQVTSAANFPQGDRPEPSANGTSQPIPAAQTVAASGRQAELSGQSANEAAIAEPAAAVVNEQVIQLLEERLQIDRAKRKVGEIVVRKAVETRLVQVPIRREKLIIEQVGTARPLAEIDIGSGEITGLDWAQGSTNAAGEPTVSGTFTSPQTVIRLFDTIARTLRHRCKQINLELLLEDRNPLKTYHQLPSPQIASQLLTAIGQAFGQRCQQITVELVLEDREIQRTYQQWFDHYRHP
jgi:stress response protein YsnF